MSERSHPLPFKLSAIWPEGLKSLHLTMGLSRTDFDPSEVQKILEKRGLPYRRRDAELLFPLSGQGGFVGYWGRVEILPAPDSLADVRALVVTLSIWPEGDRESIVPPNALSLDEFPPLLEGVVQPNLDAHQTVVSGNFSLSTRSWQPAVRLPVQLPGVLESASGTPEITGFEFMFREPDSELKRAEISLDVTGSDFSINLMALISPSPADNLIQRACDLLTQHLGLLALRRPRPETAEHV